jgi:osmotically-inducible protein OsmY
MRLFTALLMFLVLLLPAAAADKVSDDEIYDQVRIRIANDRDIGGMKIDVKVNSGEVELIGTVRHERQRERAEKVAKKVKGVQRVVNSLKVAPI